MKPHKENQGENTNPIRQGDQAESIEDPDNFPGYPKYPAEEDIYEHSRKEGNLDPEDPERNKTPNEKSGSRNEKDFPEDVSGDDLDVPGAELDDRQEGIGSEDEENNYYSLGADKD